MTPPSILITSFARLSAAEVIALARTVKTKLSNHPAFPEPWPHYVPSLQKLSEVIDLLESAHHESLTRDTIKIAERNSHNEIVKSHLSTIARHVELVANGEANVLMTTGFPMRRQRVRTSAARVLDAPPLTVKHGKLPGSMIGKVSKPAGVASFEVEITEGDPTVEANWRRLGTYARAFFEVSGLQAGKNYSFRSRYISTSGPGPWSNPFTLMSL